MIGFLYVLGLDYLPHILPRTVDYKLGEAVQKQVEQQFKTCDTKEANLFFTEAIKKIKPPNNNYKYSVSLINRPEPNAISLSNGKIYFFTGLLSNAKNQAEVVGVLAHEIAHVEKRHHVRNLTKALGTTFAISVLIGPGLGDYQFVETLTELGSTFLILKYSRDFESEADQTSIELLKKTNFTTKGLMTFFETIKDYESNFKTEKKNENSGSKQNNPSKPSFDITEFLSTHPATEQRIEDLKSFLPQENKNVKTEIVSKQMWEKIQSACAD
jgi:predicted Zn-dependent protease